ncbi:MAG: hypothetical protein ABIH87_01240 [bacterium]
MFKNLKMNYNLTKKLLNFTFLLFVIGFVFLWTGQVFATVGYCAVWNSVTNKNECVKTSAVSCDSATGQYIPLRSLLIVNFNGYTKQACETVLKNVENQGYCVSQATQQFSSQCVSRYFNPYLKCKSIIYTVSFGECMQALNKTASACKKHSDCVGYDSYCLGGKCVNTKTDLQFSQETCHKDSDCVKNGNQGICNYKGIPGGKFLAKYYCYYKKGAITPQPTKTITWKSKIPEISIRIPGLTFASIQNSITVDTDGHKVINIPWIGQYITAVYKFALALVSVVAVVMLIIQGVTIMMSGGGEAKQGAYKKILQIFVGLGIMWGSYAMLYNINPDLVKFKALAVTMVEKEESTEEVPNSNDNVKYNLKGEKTFGPILEKVSKKVGIEYCLVSAQISRESGWSTGAHTSYAFGLGQVSWYYATTLLSSPTKKAQIVSYHSKNDSSTYPVVPSGLTYDADVKSLPKDQRDALKQKVGDWLMADAEANIIITTLSKKSSLSNTSAFHKGNPILAAVNHYYGMGAYSKFLKKMKEYRAKGLVSDTQCTEAGSVSLTEFLQAAKDGNTTKLEDLYNKSCIPPNKFAWTNYKTSGAMPYFCPPTKKGDTMQCCTKESLSTGTCIMPTHTANGNKGFCFDGVRKGEPCNSTGALNYVKKYSTFLQQCLNRKKT